MPAQKTSLPASPVRPAFPPASDDDRRLMAAAIALGQRNAGRTWPNPSVGALIVRDDGAGPVVVGRGVTAAGGRPHAEPQALAAAGAAARGATAYVSLEPCSHYGRTGPCALALREAGIARVVSAVADPNPLVAGQGHAMLAEGGVAVTAAILPAEGARAHAGHFRRVRDGRPHVRVKMAVSADGCVGRSDAGQIALSSPEARADVHAMRATHDAILIGIRTALNDDPELTCRLPGLEAASPVRIVLDSLGQLPPGSKLVRTARAVPVWIVTGPKADPARLAVLEAAGVRILRVAGGPHPGGRIDPGAAFAALGDAGLTTVLAEGGPTVAGALLDADLVDEIVLDCTPRRIGPGGVPLFGGGIAGLLAHPRFVETGRRHRGDDLVIHLWRREPG